MMTKDDWRLLAWETGVISLVVGVVLKIGGPWALIAVAIILIAASMIRSN